MASNTVSNSLQGSLSVRTLSIFKLDPSGTKPIEPIIDIIPGLSGNRITLDVITSESYSKTFDVTDNPLQDFSFATSNIRAAPRIMSVSGIMSSIIQTGLSSIPFQGIPTPNNSRADLVRFQNLENLANQRMPVGVYTPRHAFPTCAITSISADWDPDTGRNTRITVSFKEIVIVSPFTGLFVPDYTASVASNNSTVGGGQQTAQPSQLQAAPQSSFGNGPTFSTPFA